MKQIIISHSGKQHSYHVADSLNKLGALKRFYTSSYVSSKMLQRMVINGHFAFLNKRFLAGLHAPKVQSNWRFEVAEVLSRKFGSTGADVNSLVFKRDIAFDQYLSKQLIKAHYDVFWGFQGSSLQCIKTAKEMNRQTVCEMTIAHLPFAKAILNEEAKLHPDWAETIDFSNFPRHYEERLISEPHVADRVVAISAFLKRTLVDDGIDPLKVHTLPLGCDIDAIKFDADSSPPGNRPLRVLYAGRVTQRKGMTYLLDAIKIFDKKDVQLHIIGNLHGAAKSFRAQKNLYQYTPGLSQSDMFQTYGDYDVLVLPSLAEGFGLVSIEAMAAGLPVITTPNTNAAEILQDGVNGFLVPIRNPKAIADAIAKFRGMDDSQFQSMRMSARETALQFTWSDYMVRLSNFVNLL